MSHYGPGRDWVRRCVAVCGRPRSDKIFAPRSTVISVRFGRIVEERGVEYPELLRGVR